MSGYLKEANIKEDLPAAGDAVKRITFHIRSSKELGAGAVKIIHGYGSTGAGEKIRNMARQYLEDQKKKGRIRDFIPGEEFSHS
ncbi:MAG: Smr/MutS family protein [Oscillospiraceae bacterium]|nr:Smr/MutS family protein [Oscillospiraceae bacterium]